LKILKYIIPALLLFIAFLIFMDASIYTLMPNDPISGRTMACYTTIELLFGAKHPTWIRGAEYIVALAMIPFSIFIFLFIGRITKRRGGKRR
jgi:hypothetical protein